MKKPKYTQKVNDKIKPDGHSFRLGLQHTTYLLKRPSSIAQSKRKGQELKHKR